MDNKITSKIKNVFIFFDSSRFYSKVMVNISKKMQVILKKRKAKLSFYNAQKSKHHA